MCSKKGYRWKRLRYCPCPPKDPFYVAYKQADWHRLKQWVDEGIIRLVYLDESGVERISPLVYSYSLRGQQHRLPKPQRRERRLNTLGFWEPDASFDYSLVSVVSTLNITCPWCIGKPAKRNSICKQVDKL